jgi:hypothetical protein
MVMERRRYERIPVQVFAIVTTNDGERIEVIVVEISRDILGIEVISNNGTSLRQRGVLFATASRYPCLLILICQMKMVNYLKL